MPSATTLLLLLAHLLLLQLEPLHCRLQFLLPLQDFSHQLVEGHPGIIKGLGAGLHIDNPDVLGNFPCLFLGNFPALLQIDLIPDEKQVDFGDISFLVDLLDPEVNHFEGLLIRNIKDEQDPVDVAIVVGSDGVVAGSAGGIPDLYPDGAAVLQLEGLLFVLYPDRYLVIGFKLLVYILR